MPRGLLLLVIGLFFGFGTGFLVALSSGAEMAGHDHGDAATIAHAAAHDHGADDHHDAAHHALIEAGSDVGLKLELHPDSARSRNLHIVTRNFTFAPEAVNGPHVPGQGHAHIYVNGVKLARAYGPWQQLHALPAGDHRVRVTLNANSHNQLAIDGVPVEATLDLTIE